MPKKKILYNSNNQTVKVQDIPLTPQQKRLAFAGILTSGWVERPGKNARMGVQVTEEDLPLLKAWKGKMGHLIAGSTRTKVQTLPWGDKRQTTSFSEVTVAHPNFTELFDLVKPNGQKKKSYSKSKSN